MQRSLEERIHFWPIIHFRYSKRNTEGRDLVMLTVMSPSRRTPTDLLSHLLIIF